MAFAGLALFLTLLLTHTSRAKTNRAPRPQTTPSNEVCYEGIKPGNYATAIDIHNPSPVTPVSVYAKAVQDNVTLAAIRGPFQLSADGAQEISCKNIGSPLDIGNGYASFIKGYVLVFANGVVAPGVPPAPLPLDVVAVYSSEPPGVQIPIPYQTSGSTQTKIPGIALDVFTIVPRLEAFPAASGALPAGQYYEYAAEFLCGEAPIEAPPCVAS